MDSGPQRASARKSAQADSADTRDSRDVTHCVKRVLNSRFKFSKLGVENAAFSMNIQEK